MKVESIVINRAKRANGQLSGVIRMMEEERDCIDVITQLSAVRSSVDRMIGMIGMIVAENLYDCIQNPEEDVATQQKKIDKAMQLIMNK